jgi:hypothetical protein
MFDDWKRAWQEAVENFNREIEDDDVEPGPAQIGAMRRDLSAARKALDRLIVDLERCREELTEEQRQEETCRRRGDMAAAINDQTTVTIALQWAERHSQRAAILLRKSDALRAELEMRQDDLKGMEQQVRELQDQWLATGGTVPPGVAGAPSGASSNSRPGPMPRSTDRDKQDSDFRKLDREAREKAAEARLEELKKRMQ